MSGDAPGEAGPARLAALLREAGVLTDDWLPAYAAVPRHRFVPDAIWPGRAGMNRQEDRVVRGEQPDVWWEAVNRDAPITTQWDDGAFSGPGRGRMPTSSSSMPSMVFRMLGALQVAEGTRVLEIGTGTGWNAGLLSYRLGGENVVSVEVHPASAQAARSRLERAGLHPLVHVGDGARGFPDRAPYDRVLATCSVGRVPRAWREQTVPGGVIVTPWGPTYGGEAVVRLTVGEDGTAEGPFVGSSAFMRMSAQRKLLPSTRAFAEHGEGAASWTRLSPDDVGDWVQMFAIGVQVPDLFCRVEPGEGGAYRLRLMDTGVTAWATADYERGREAFRVVQAGARRLWEELEAAWDWWAGQGRPGFERFGLTVDGLGERVWLDEPHRLVPVHGPAA
ncbi:methyltransferase domain-containing protein [Streptomyces sp. NPDC087440]|uniref:methyltransferase domain-containing protein n=1 Tax=Streptomyces sp. NPDC087440 TaxID=3365790 RepID=UPI003828EA13